MKAFQCEGCGSLLFFDSVKCVTCGHTLGFLPLLGQLSAMESLNGSTWKALSAGANGVNFRQCSNSLSHQVCNWMVEANDPEVFCISCRLNQIIPDLSDPTNHGRWHRLEMAKRRGIYTVLKLGLPLESGPDGSSRPLRFCFISDIAGAPPVITGHANGVITINIVEADDDERERRRVSLHEPYRTLLGHLRHEIGHYYWDRLIGAHVRIDEWRALFGDERQDYKRALDAYYQQGPSADWSSKFVSAYASAHPWEDWAESWAHYFHIIDTVETASSFGMRLKPEHPAARTMSSDPQKAGQINVGFDALLNEWFPLTFALNSLNRGMGLPDLYPFALSTMAIQKLRFIHEIVRGK